MSISEINKHFEETIILDDKFEIVDFYQFYRNRKLSSIIIPDKVTKIKDFAFYGCEGLKYFEFPEKIDEIGSSAFKKCENLEEFICKGESCKYVSKDGVVYSKDGACLVKYPPGKKGDFSVPSEVKRINDDAFRHCLGISRIFISSKIKEIGEEAFYGCKNLKEVIINDDINIVNIIFDDSAFAKCESLEYFKMPGKADFFNLILGETVFNECMKLETIMIPASVEEINNNVFNGCQKLTIECEKDSFVLKYARKNKIQVKII